MQNHDIPYLIAFILGCILLSSCATTHTPSEWLPDADELSSGINGGWVEIESKQGQRWGELITVREDSVFVADTLLRAIAASDIVSARLVMYNESSLAGYVLLGTLSTLSHGYFLMFTAPLWLFTGTLASAARTYEPIVDYPAQPLKDFTPFARYPQGLPDELDRILIRMNMHPKKKN